MFKFEPNEEIFTQIGVVQGGLGKCRDPTLSAIFSRLEDPAIISFIKPFIDSLLMYQGMVLETTVSISHLLIQSILVQNEIVLFG